MRIILTVLLAVVACAGQTTTNAKPGAEYGIQPNPERDPWQKPALVISSLNFSTTETVVVIESGYPYFAPRIAPLVKKVYAVNSDARAFQGPGKLPPSITTIVSTKTNPGIANLKVDTVIVVAPGPGEQCIVVDPGIGVSGFPCAPCACGRTGSTS